MKPTHFALVGGGWRAAFYLRVAQALPDDFAIDGLVVRNWSKGLELESRWGVKAYGSVEELLAEKSPEFVVTSVAWDANPPLIRQLAHAGMPVLSETPPARDLAGLRELWSVAEQGARIQVAEQYIYQPHHAARLALVSGGSLGTVSQAQVSAAHGYHGVSLIRHLLGRRRIAAITVTSPAKIIDHNLRTVRSKQHGLSSADTTARSSYNSHFSVQ